jgi:hypothetical protein
MRTTDTTTTSLPAHMGVKLLAGSMVVVESAFGVELPKEIASHLIHLRNVEA